MAGLLFIPQSTLDAWLEAGTVDIAAEGLKIMKEDVTFEILPAFHFVSMLEGEDAAGLLSKVKTEDQIKELGAEAYGDSVILGEVGYSGVPGFVTILKGPIAGAAASASPPPSQATAGPGRATNPSMPSSPATSPGVPAAAAAAAAPAASAPEGQKQKKEEADLLSQFLLDKLS